MKKNYETDYYYLMYKGIQTEKNVGGNDEWNG